MTKPTEKPTSKPIKAVLADYANTRLVISLRAFVNDMTRLAMGKDKPKGPRNDKNFG